ncbi:MAG TPA: FtsX-like permease family protein, partial [Candidatus Limnocylindrales bacterium]|nr:FtsX-like permease family protein [Candidatus Limnocylindrales bacterium]
MRIYDMIELSGRNLREAVLRNSLTTLGIGVGVASLVAMLSLGVGLQKLATRQLGRSGLFDSIVVTSRALRAPRFGQTNVPVGQPKVLDDAARNSFEQISEVVEVYPNFSAVGEFRLDGARPEDAHFTVVGGLPGSAHNSEAFDDVQGTFFTSPDAREVILLSEFARTLLGLPEKDRLSDPRLTREQADQLLGRDIILRYAERSQDTPAPAVAQKPGAPQKGDAEDDDSGGAGFNVVRREQRLKIVGIVDTEPYRGMRNGRTSAYLPIAFAESLNMMQPGDLSNIMRPGQGKTYTALVVRVAKSKDVEHVEGEIKKAGFNTFSILDASQGITKFFRVLDMFLGIFGSLALAVASLGIVNTLVMAILERRREIGIMKAVGASDGDVKRIFFIEAGSMGMLGGALGVAMGWIIGRAINFGTNIYLQRQEIQPENFWYVPMWLVIGGVVFS